MTKITSRTATAAVFLTLITGQAWAGSDAGTDLSKPLFVKAGYPLCPTKDAMDNLIKVVGKHGVPSNLFAVTGCKLAAGTTPVVSTKMDASGYYVTLALVDRFLTAVWVAGPELSNNPTETSDAQ